ncbi:MAG TPA: GNAT family N-acetyltransferase [Candidatus Dormibacteraeota bacterium]|nr:GNAT family N-acetyltransferase [Candidatus Dormibacteraeota bacterium]
MSLANGEETRTRELRIVSGASPREFLTARENLKVRVRPYQPADRPAIRKLCCDTGFLGNPIDSVFRDRDLFADLFTGAYLAYEPEWALVAEVNGRLVGYLLGSVRKDFDQLLMRYGFPIAAKMCFRWVRRRYAAHPRSAGFVRWLLSRGYHEQPKHPADAAHLHLDLDDAYRGRGVARRLWETYEKQLCEAGIDQCYGAFFSHPQRRPEPVYARYGFTEFDRKPTTLFSPELSDVEVVCVRKFLANGANGVNGAH